MGLILESLHYFSISKIGTHLDLAKIKNLVHLLDNYKENIDTEKMISLNQMSLIMSK